MPSSEGILEVGSSGICLLQAEAHITQQKCFSSASRKSGFCYYRGALNRNVLK